MPKGQTVLITGATAGIGRHAALYLAAKGHRVIATGRNTDALATIRAQVPVIDTISLDVTDTLSIDAAVTEVDRLTDGRGVDVLINNAGYGVGGPLLGVSDTQLREQFDVNVFGLMAVTRAFAPKMMARRSGRILNVSSVAGRFSLPLLGAYHATKFAVETMSDSLRMELAPYGIQVVVIEPGPIRTDFPERLRRELGRLDTVGSPYALLYAHTDKLHEHFNAQAVGPEHTSRAMAEAIAARHPKARYVAPFRFRLVIAAMGLLPTRLTDAIMTRASGLSQVRPGAPSPSRRAEQRARA